MSAGRPRRFEPIGVVDKGGRKVVHLLETKTGRELWIYKRGQRWVHWDRMDAFVTVPLLTHTAKVALEDYEGVELA